MGAGAVLSIFWRASGTALVQRLHDLLPQGKYLGVLGDEGELPFIAEYRADGT